MRNTGKTVIWTLLVLALMGGMTQLSAEPQAESPNTGAFEPSGDIVIFHAGSLSVPLNRNPGMLKKVKLVKESW